MLRGTLAAFAGTVIAAAGLVAFDSAQSPVMAQASFGKGASRASPLLVARTQRRILRTEDSGNNGCPSPTFVEATVVKAPERVQVASSIEETKWQEYWRLDRCGREVGYWVFFTEVGQGGAYFSILSNE